jgi:RND family efflux transporter MFP subunit
MKKTISELLLIAMALFFLVPRAATAQDLEGMIEPYEIVKVSSQVAGVIETIPVERGDLVKKGQVIATLKSGVEAANVKLAQSQVDLSRRKLGRNKDLFVNKLISEQEKDEIETDLKKNEAMLQDAQEKLEMRIIRSTIDGVVVKRELSPGEYISEKHIMVIAMINPLNVEVVVPVRRHGSIYKGMTAEVRPEAPVGGVYYGKVVIVDKVIDAASGTYGVRVELPNANLKLPAGLKCKVQFLRK